MWESSISQIELDQTLEDGNSPIKRGAPVDILGPLKPPRTITNWPGRSFHFPRVGTAPKRATRIVPYLET
jgi:hypothetical protein